MGVGLGVLTFENIRTNNSLKFQLIYIVGEENSQVQNCMFYQI